jgi:hypothetical protein
MRHLQARNDRFLQEFWQLDEALQWMRDRDQIYKAELIELLRARGATAVSATVGEDFA